MQTFTHLGRPPIGDIHHVGPGWILLAILPAILRFSNIANNIAGNKVARVVAVPFSIHKKVLANDRRSPQKLEVGGGIHLQK